MCEKGVGEEGPGNGPTGKVKLGPGQADSTILVGQDFRDTYIR